ncbi:MAG: 2-iminoacetate synthase ThiH [Elusimicrobiales bacterium]|nr:2-iminoacetate synthase ThiH [Elusimicrobiales bacterium]
MKIKTFEDELEKLNDLYYRNSTKKIDKHKLWLVEFLENLRNEKLNLYEIAIKAKKITESFFGKSVLLYVPLYISDYCVNGCLYCGFSARKDIKRKKLSFEEITKELKTLKEKNFDTVLILTGEDKINTPLSYIKETVEIVSKLFSEVLIEIYPLNTEEYKELVKHGVVGVTIYQETYDKNLYEKLHLFGPKKNYSWRINSPQRALQANIKEITIGPLLGLNEDWKYDVFMAVAHADYLQDNFPNSEINISFPRIRKSVAENKCYDISDKDFVKAILLSRIFLPRVGINLSTRENPWIRDNLVGIAATRISAESKTTVGGYFNQRYKEVQFEVSDSRSLEEIIKALMEKGIRPEFTNWIKNYEKK